ncbi:MAG: hypothetical protein IJ836_06470 [Spirochaetales bacterium]|nr:hypothetical protein [Spirochaetales bacterium]
MGDQTPVIIGPSISKDIAYIHVEKTKNNPTVLVGESIQKDVAIFMSYADQAANDLLLDAFPGDEIIEQEDFES